MRNAFNKFAENSAEAVGSSWAFLLACLSMLAWAITGPYFHYSDTWQLVVNSITDVVTFLMVFLIQNAQNRDTSVLTLKLDELLRGVKGARTSFIGLDKMSEDELKDVKKEFARLRKQYAPLDEHIEHINSELSARRRKHRVSVGRK